MDTLKTSAETAHDTKEGVNVVLEKVEEQNSSLKKLVVSAERGV